jgi:hypothetical protein
MDVFVGFMLSLLLIVSVINAIVSISSAMILIKIYERFKGEDAGQSVKEANRRNNQSLKDLPYADSSIPYQFEQR